MEVIGVAETAGGQCQFIDHSQRVPVAYARGNGQVSEALLAPQDPGPGSLVGV